MGYYDVPNRLNVPGEDLPKVIHYYKEAHPYYNHDVVVVGAGVVAVHSRHALSGFPGLAGLQVREQPHGLFRHLLHALPELVASGIPVLVGASRKRFLGSSYDKQLPSSHRLLPQE